MTAEDQAWEADDPDDDWRDDYDPLDDYYDALDRWEPDCSCYGHGCPRCGSYAPGWRGRAQRAGQWLRRRRYTLRDRWDRARRRTTYDDSAPF